MNRWALGLKGSVNKNVRAEAVSVPAPTNEHRSALKADLCSFPPHGWTASARTFLFSLPTVGGGA